MDARAAAPRPAAGVQPRLGTATRTLHWLVGLAVIGLLAYGFWLQTLPSGPDKGPYVQIHKSFGLLIFAAALARLLWRWREGFPQPVRPERRWQRRAALTAHTAMIAATVLMPVTGILRSLAYGRSISVFGLPVIPQLFAQKQETLYAISSNTHDALAFALAALIGLHVTAALKHHFVDRDGTLRRMLGGSARAG